jgi:trigger factor
MKVEFVEQSPIERKVTVEVPIADVDAAFDRVYRELRRDARLPGFRPGKVPRSVLEKYFGARAQRDVLEQLVRETLPPAFEGVSETVVSEPRIGIDVLPVQGAPVSYYATYEVNPEIELKAVRGLPLARRTPPAPEGDPVEAQLERLRHDHAAVVDEPEGTTVAQGSLAIVNIQGWLGGDTADGKPEMARDGLEIEVGSGGVLPGVEEGIVGMRVGESRTLDLVFPDDSGEALAGKPLRVELTLTALKRRDLATLDDELAKDVSEHATLAELREAIRVDYAHRREAEVKRLRREAVIDALIDANPFPVPPSLVEREVAHDLSRVLGGARLPREQMQEMADSLREQWRPLAERQVRFGLLAGAIVRAEGMEVTDADFEAEVARMAEAAGRPAEALLRELHASRDGAAVAGLRSRMLEDRVVELVLREAGPPPAESLAERVEGGE